MSNRVNVLDFGADPSGVNDSFSAIMAAIAAANQLGGGSVNFGRGLFRISQPLVVGDGSDANVSSRDHRIRLVGEGFGSHDGQDFVQQQGATEILYDGPTSDSAAVISLAGPLHAVGVEHITLNCNRKAGVGLLVNHVADSAFIAVMAKAYTRAGYVLTTRSLFPPACAYGCGNNVFLHCYGVMPASSNAQGIALSSGVSETKSLTGQPDAANNDFIGGVFFYGGSALSSGIYLHGADNNTFQGLQVIPASSPSYGWAVFFQPWAGDPRFPLENAFHNIGAKNPVGGVSGSLGNTFTIFQEGDGAPLPVLPHVNATSHSSIEIVQGKRVWRTRDIVQQTLTNTAIDTISASYVQAEPFSVVLAHVKSGAKLRVRFSGRVGKINAGTAKFIFALNGFPIQSSMREVPSNLYLQALDFEALVDAPSGGTFTFNLMFSSSDGNVARVTDGSLVVEELF
ncbi:glycosyl hydrolase family 28-related protein [Achromobacter anxifer]